MTLATETTPLSTALREGTATAHDETEGSDFMTRLLAGELNEEALVMYTGQLWFVYDALERAVRSFAGNPIIDAVNTPGLERVESLESDLTAVRGENWRDSVRLLPATAQYVERIEKLTKPHEVIAHHYTRYLGDVSGGQVIAARLGRQYGWGPESLTFYDFTAVGKPVPFRRDYREALDQMDLNAEQRAELIEEARVAFGLNYAVFRELSQAIAA